MSSPPFQKPGAPSAPSGVFSVGDIRRNARVHDPSTIVRCGAFYYVFATGPGITSWRSTDLQRWEKGPSVFPTGVSANAASDRPAWWASGEVVPAFDGACWAPDIIKQDKRYLLYYSVSAWGKRTSAIGLAASPTLDPADPKYGWSDQGIVVQTRETDDHNAIDPSVCRDPRSGDLWLAFGSFWSGIKMVRLDAKTGKRYQNPAEGLSAAPIAVAWNATIEAPCLYCRDRWWYLFVNWGNCCRGVDSTYEIRVGRSARPDGPFRDREGRDLLKNGGGVFLAGEKKGAGAFIGPGHAGIVTVGKNDFLSCHFYDGDKSGAPTLGILPLAWDADGWPLVR